MKYSFLILFFFLCTACFSQDLEFLQELIKVQKLIDEENFNEANDLLIKMKPVAEKEYGQNSERFAKFLHLLGSTNTRLQNLEPAIFNYEKCLEILKNIGKQDEQFYVVALFNLAELYTIQGQYHKSESIYVEGLKKIEEVFGLKNPYYYKYISKVGNYYFSLANYEKAKYYEEITNKFFKKNFGSESGEYLSSTNNLARIYQETGDTINEQLLYREILPILKKFKKQPNSKDYINTINLLGGVNFRLKNYEEAAENYNLMLQYYERNNAKDHTSYANILNNLSVTYDKLGDLNKAIQLQKESINIVVNKKGKKSKEYITAIKNLAAKYIEFGNLDLSETLSIEAIHLTNEDISEKNMFMSEGEKENYLDSQIYDYYVFNSFSLIYKNKSQAITGEVFNNSLFLKGRLLSSSITLRKSILDSNNNEIITKFNEWIAVKKEISEFYETEDSQTKKNIKALEANENSLEKFLVSNSKSFNEFQIKENYKWQDVQKKLKSNEVAIEFIDFEYYKEKWTGQRYYCALVLKAESNFPEMIFLFEETQLGDLLSKNSNNDKYSIPLLYGSKKNKKDDLYNLIWKPIENTLKGKEKVFIAPSGLLNNISFSGLTNKNKYLSDEFYLVQLTTTAKIIDSRPFEIAEIQNATLFGGIDYGQSSNQWPYLMGTKEELIEAKNILSDHNINTETYSESNATENAFKNFTSNSQIIHIATHGFFRSTPSVNIKDEKGKVDFDRGGDYVKMNNQENSLLKSGLVFAGANYKKDSEILTALEVSQMDLNRTKLVVLSACETGLGDIKGNEGVYGLQRSFKLAGVDYLLLSLWKVPDFETKDFMASFYKNLFIEKDVRKAFKATQQEKSKIYDPYYWAAFILID